MAHEHREIAPTVQARKDVPQHAAETVTASQRPQAEVLAGPPGREALPERGRVVLLMPLLPGPCRLLSLCAMVRGLGKGHGDAHPFMPQHGTEASLSPAAGTSSAAFEPGCRWWF